MKTAAPVAILTSVIVLLVVCVVYALDEWLGILAYKFRYIGFSILIAATVAGVWRMVSRKTALVAGLAAFALLMTPFAIQAPSSRILREVVIQAKPGTTGSEAETMVRQAYQNSGYAMPQIRKTVNHMTVSLYTQREGDSTTASFLLKDGVVTDSSFSQD